MEKAELIVKTLSKRGMTISAAESCTGGLFAKTITDCAGASAVLNESYVTYSPEAKMRILGVKTETIDTFTVVSGEVAKEMAEGVKKVANADIGVAFTGYAGPDGDDVGLVYMAIADDSQTMGLRLNLAGGRAQIREQAVEIALDEIEKIIG